MGVTITDKDSAIFARHGINDDMIADTVAQYREEGMADEEIQERFNRKVAELSATPSDPGVNEHGERIGSQADTYRRAVENDPDGSVAREAKNLARASSYLSSFSMGLSDWAAGKLFGDEYAEAIKASRELYPQNSFAAELAGYVSPGGAASAAVKGGMKLAAKVGAGRAKKAITKWAIGAGSVALTSEAEMQVQKTAERLAGTREWDEEMGAAQEMGEGVVTNMALQAVFAGTGVLGKAARKWYSADAKAIKTLGGAENVAKAQKVYAVSKGSGATESQARGAFLASLTENMDAKQANRMVDLINKDKDFAQFMADQLASSKQIVIDDVVQMTRAEANKASREALNSIWENTDMINRLGTTEVDLSKNSVKQMLGLDSKKFLDVRQQALLRAEEKVMSNASLARQVNNEFRSLSGDLITNGSKDLNRAFKSVEPGTIKSFQGSGAMEDALRTAQEKIAKAQEAAQAAGQQFGPAEIQKIEMEAMREGAENHLRRIFAEGTDSVQDINDIKNFFSKLDEGAVSAGQAEAFGAFNEGVNTRILDTLDDELYKANQAMRASKPLEKAWTLGNTIDEFRVGEIESFLNDTTSAAQKTAKLAVMKQGFYAKYADALIKGDKAAVSRMQNMLRSQNSMGRFVSPEEFNEVYIKAIQPKVVAANNIEKFMGATNKYQPNDLSRTIAQLGIATVIKMPVVFFNKVVDIMSGTYYGTAVSRKMQKMLSNPNWRDFNKIVNETTDLTERQVLKKAITQATQAIIQSNELNELQGK